MLINVQGGTGAGTRVVRQQSKDWVCSKCKTENRYYWLSCPNCGASRET